ncbi:hypothetical protein [Hyunsoonleella ulvae]|uniref:hypothetical protein n=1 Tax=Hyunsoonleella ulvae TaxID=2799948 RepID=UPI001939A8D1|nr:hypothetical protein [Hyunsoonleella ulvae]
MEQLISVKPEYASLEKIEEFIKKETSFEAKKEYDSWEVRTDANGQMEKCVIVKKSNMHGAKIHFTKDNKMKVSYIIPNKIMNTYFGKSQKKYQNIIEVITGKIKDLILAGSQKTAFEEMTQSFSKISI